METELELSHEPGSNVFYGDKIELPNRGFKLKSDGKMIRRQLGACLSWSL